MGKPKNNVYKAFCKRFEKINEDLNMKQYIVPYLMSSHPGSTLKEAIELAEYIRDLGYMPEQVQDFYPTPSTISTCMYYTGVDPRTMEPVYVPTNPHEKAMQRALIQYRNPENYELVKEALIKEGRKDLIGMGKECLIPPRQFGGGKQAGGSSNKNIGKNPKGNGKSNTGNTKNRNISNNKNSNKNKSSAGNTNRSKKSNGKRR